MHPSRGFGFLLIFFLSSCASNNIPAAKSGGPHTVRMYVDATVTGVNGEGREVIHLRQNLAFAQAAAAEAATILLERGYRMPSPAVLSVGAQGGAGRILLLTGANEPHVSKFEEAPFFVLNGGGVPNETFRAFFLRQDTTAGYSYHNALKTAQSDTVLLIRLRGEEPGGNFAVSFVKLDGGLLWQVRGSIDGPMTVNACAKAIRKAAAGSTE